ncbi:extracellular solute-binding protein [Oleisolibacter albus]|uniref:sensor histidine kinase n=1 Tax=Oleisolibacter albus TaxID=2171757 RepID=UPI000DF4BFE4|nr:extracellular solute-binding protein [Oleisolibacter albus]
MPLRPGSPKTGLDAVQDAGSLRQRLMVRLLIVLAVVAGFLFVQTRMDAKRAADSAYDQLLLASALTIADAVRVENQSVTVDLPPSSLSILAMAQQSRVFYKVLDAAATPVIGYGDLPGSPRQDDTAVFSDSSYLGVPVRMVSLGHLIVQARSPHWVTIVVAQTREERNALTQSLFLNSFRHIILLVLVSTGLVWFGVRQALAPLTFLGDLIRSRRPNDFSPIEAAAPTEVRQLLGAINTLTGRLHGHLESTKTFLADMAHQIRTPLAALRSQAELALEGRDPDKLRRSVERIHHNAVEASELTTQLLSHAMVVHRSEALHPAMLDLTLLANQVVQRAATLAEDTVFRVEQDGEDPVTVCGDAVILREALVNLVDNAVKYGGQAGAVEMRLYPGDGTRGPVVEVADRGPGIPDEEKPAVLSRFGRGSSSAGTVGSGLGLAIVAAVADGHGAGFDLLDRPGGGLIARITFPQENLCSVPPPSPARRRGGMLALLPLAVLLLWPESGQARQLVYPAPAAETERLRIASATDLAVMDVLIRDFQAHHPGVTVEYDEVTTGELYDHVAHPRGRVTDLVISSAADLQVKLVNDGLTQPHHSKFTAQLPRWANWRDEAFAFTQEPAVFVYNRTLVPEADVPQTRDDLIHLIRDKADAYNGRIATYDIVQSGIGYLLATQDSVLNSQFWQLADALADRHVRQFCCTGEMLDSIERGDSLIGYNLLGSYARARQLAGAPIGIVLPSDYTLVITRVAVIPKASSARALAGRFIDYLLSPEGQGLIAHSTPLYTVFPVLEGPFSAAQLMAELNGPLQHADLGPPLLVFLDETKRMRFLRQWQMIMARP